MDGQPSQGVGLDSCPYYAWRRAQYGHSASPSPATRMSFASLFTVFSTTLVHHSLLGASVVLQYCTCASNYAFVVEPIFVINMVGYELSDCLLSNSKHVVFKLGITLHTVCKSETPAIDVEIKTDSRIHYMCDQSPLHTRHPLENCLR